MKYILILLITGFCGHASAATWYLYNFYFEGTYVTYPEAPATGSFDYDPVNGYHNVDIVAAGIYSDDGVGGGTTVSFTAEPTGVYPRLEVTWAEDLATTLGPVDVVYGPTESFEISESYSSADSCYSDSYCRRIAAGAYISTSPSEVPLPAAAWLFISAIGGLGLMRLRTQER